MTTWLMQLHHEATMVRRSLDFDFFKRRKLKPLKKPEADKIKEAVFDDGVDDDDDDDDDHDNDNDQTGNAPPLKNRHELFVTNICAKNCYQSVIDVAA